MMSQVECEARAVNDAVERLARRLHDYFNEFYVEHTKTCGTHSDRDVSFDQLTGCQAKTYRHLARRLMEDR